ncbi:hypothetical protein ACOSQ4_021278 [Xanthoceras sorbifolium]
MKCCSLKRKDLDHHYKKMSERYYMLNELQTELQRHNASTRRNLSDITMGEIHQMALKKFEKVCQKPHIQIKYKPDKCSCPTNQNKAE